MGILSEFGEIERDLRSRIATLEAELAAEREAVRVLAKEATRWAKSYQGVMSEEYGLDDYRWQTEIGNDVLANPIASAAITDAAKAREGA